MFEKITHKCKQGIGLQKCKLFLHLHKTCVGGVPEIYSILRVSG